MTFVLVSEFDFNFTTLTEFRLTKIYFNKILSRVKFPQRMKSYLPPPAPLTREKAPSPKPKVN